MKDLHSINPQQRARYVFIYQKKTTHQISLLKQRFAQINGNPFSDILSSDKLKTLVEKEVEEFRERIFSPMVTISTFVRQVLEPDQSCRNAVAKLRAERGVESEETCSLHTGSYCKARKRLSESLFHELVCETGQSLEKEAKTSWRWKGRVVKLVDGSTLSMPDTPENQEAYPQPESQKKGVGFPIARIVGIISLSCGSVIDLAIGPYQGKATGEHALLRQLVYSVSAGDILLADRYYCSYWLIALLLAKGVDVLFQQHASRKSDFRSGKKLGVKDHWVIWEKPKQKPEWMDQETWLNIPESLTLREVKSEGKVLVTSLLNPKEVSRKELAELYTKRWLVEVDLKAIKDTMQMGILRCKTPEMVRKEIWVHLLAYNLIRTVMAQAAYHADLHPRNISFKATLQSLNALHDILLIATDDQIQKLLELLWSGVASQRVGNRPGRSEPRAVKRRPKPYPRLKKPRNEARKELKKSA